jgi:predicted RNA-binding protein with PUA-like domain
MAERYWLFKTEPSAYSFDDLVRDGVAEWDGVRNFQVRNWIRDDIKVGDGVLFYHSSTKPTGVVGTARVVRDAYPDHTAWDPESAHPDPKSTPDKPLWFMVDIAPDKRFNQIVTLDEMRLVPELAEMMALKRGNRFSITPVAREEFEAVVRLGTEPTA